MWWQAERRAEANAQSPDLFEVLTQLQEQLWNKYAFVSGIGSTFDSDGIRVPLIVMQDVKELVPGVSGMRLGGELYYSQWMKGPLAPVKTPKSLEERARSTAMPPNWKGMPPRSAKMPYLRHLLLRLKRSLNWNDREARKVSLLPISIAQALFSVGPHPLKDDFAREKIPINTMVLFLPPFISASPAAGSSNPLPLFPGEGEVVIVLRSGRQIWFSSRNATLGFAVKSHFENELQFITAGHLSHGQPGEIFIRRKRFLREPIEQLVGEIVRAIDPVHSQPQREGMDVAVIKPAGHFTFPEMVGPLQPAEPESVVDESEVRLNGAKSGIQRGWVVGPLVVARKVNGVTWKNCWLINEIDRGFAQPGDSGGPVFTRDGNPLGHLVCVTGKRYSNGRFQTGVVQDINSILDYVGSYSGAPVRVWA